MNPNSELNNAIQALWDKINSISSTLSDYNQQRFTLREEKKQLEKQLSQVKLENDDAQMQLEQSLQSLDYAYNRIKSLEDTLANKDNIITDLRKLEEEISQLNSDYSHLKNRYDSALVQNANLETEVGKMKLELQLFEVMKVEKAGLEEQIKELTVRSQDFEFSQQEVVRKNKDIYEKNALITELRDSISMLESKLFTFDKLKEEVATLQGREEKSQEEKDSLNKQINQLISQEEIEKKKYEERIAELEQRIALLETSNIEKSNSLVVATEKYEEQNKAHLSLIDSHAALLVKLEDEKSLSSLLKENIETLNTKIFDYLLDLQEGINRNTEQNQIALNLQERINQLEEENKEIATLNQTIDQKNEELVKQIFELDRLEKEKANLLENIELQNKSIEEYKKQLEAKLVSESTQDTLIAFYSEESKRATKELRELNAKYLEMCKEKDEKLSQAIQKSNESNKETDETYCELRYNNAKLLEQLTACKLTLEQKELSLLELANEKIALVNGAKETPISICNEDKDLAIAQLLEELTACKLTLEQKELSLLELANEKIALVNSTKDIEAKECDEDKDLEIAKLLEELTACKLTLEHKELSLLQMAYDKIDLAKNAKTNELNGDDSEALELISREKEALLAEVKELKKQNSASEKEAKEIQHELKTKFDEQMQKSSELSKNVNRMRVQMQANIDKLDKHTKVRGELIEFIENYINIIKQK